MNTLNANILNRVVVFPAKVFAPAYQDLPHRLWKVVDGFGAQLFTSGKTVKCVSVLTGEKATFDAMQIERLATDEEVEQVQAQREAQVS